LLILCTLYICSLLVLPSSPLPSTTHPPTHPSLYYPSSSYPSSTTHPSPYYPSSSVAVITTTPFLCARCLTHVSISFLGHSYTSVCRSTLCFTNLHNIHTSCLLSLVNNALSQIAVQGLFSSRHSMLRSGLGHAARELPDPQQLGAGLTGAVIFRVGQNSIYMVYTRYFGREITKHTVIYGAYMRFWPKLVILVKGRGSSPFFAHPTGLAQRWWCCANGI